MAFKPYLTYEEYVDYGGTLSEESFDVIERRAQRWLDSMTYNRIQQLTTIPDIVKEVLVEFIAKMGVLESERQSGDIITRYSNSVETIEYRRKTDAEVRRDLYRIALNWLPDYLVCRSVKFDAGRYLQSDDNDTQPT
jgi:hypothetical protein